MMILGGHGERVRGLAFSPDGATLASCGSDWTVQLWDLASGELRTLFRGHRRNIRGVVFSLDGTLLISNGHDSARVWDLARGVERTDLETPPNNKDRILYSILGASPGKVPRDRRIAAEAACWRLLPSGPWRLSGDEAIERRTDLLQRATQGRPNREMTELEFGPSNQGFFILVPVTDAGTRRGTFIPGCGFSQAPVADYAETAFSPDGRTLAVLHNEGVELGTSEGTRWTSLIGHNDIAMAMAFAPDGRTLATGGLDGSVRLWDVEAGRERACYDWDVGMIDSVAFSPDGMRIAAGGTRGIVVWDAEGA